MRSRWIGEVENDNVKEVSCLVVWKAGNPSNILDKVGGMGWFD